MALAKGAFGKDLLMDASKCFTCKVRECCGEVEEALVFVIRSKSSKLTNRLGTPMERRGNAVG